MIRVSYCSLKCTSRNGDFRGISRSSDNESVSVHLIIKRLQFGNWILLSTSRTQIPILMGKWVARDYRRRNNLNQIPRVRLVIAWLENISFPLTIAVYLWLCVFERMTPQSNTSFIEHSFLYHNFNIQGKICHTGKCS